ncbi:hypothetical protein ACFA67_004549 [Salmonella enterica]
MSKRVITHLPISGRQRHKNYISAANDVVPMPPDRLIVSELCHECEFYVKRWGAPTITGLKLFRELAELFGQDENGQPRRTAHGLYFSMMREIHGV